MDRKWHDDKGRGYDIPEGVDVRRNSDGTETVSIRFRYQGKQCRELKLPASAANISSATKKLGAIKLAIQMGSFDYSKEFPESRKGRAAGPVVSSFTVEGWNEEWLKRYGGNLKASSRTSYAQSLAAWAEALGKDTIISSITPEMVTRALSSMAVTRATIRARIPPFRLAMSSAKAAGEIAVSPLRDIGSDELRGIVREKAQTGYTIEPFTDEERAKLYEAAKRLFPGMAEIIPVWRFTGLRNGEILALEWDSHIDFERKVIHVRQQLNRLGQIVTYAKTKSGMRDVPLPPPAIEALKRQKAFSFVRNTDQPRYVFPHPTSGERWPNPNNITAYNWPTICKAAGVKYRNIYQLRHTYATTMLDRGEDARNVARWLGHKDVTILFQIYGRERVLKEKQNNFKNNEWLEAV